MARSKISLGKCCIAGAFSKTSIFTKDIVREMKKPTKHILAKDLNFSYEGSLQWTIYLPTLCCKLVSKSQQVQFSHSVVSDSL